MKISIRTRLTLLIALVFASVFILLLAAGGFALYVRLNQETERTLEVEKERSIRVFESEYLRLTTATGIERDSLTDEFLEDLNDMYGYKPQFAIFALESKVERRFYAGGAIKNIQLMLPKGFLSQNDGFHHQPLDGKRYRVLISRSMWGTLALGVENQTFFNVADELRGILTFGVPLTLILLLIGGRLLAGLVMKPVVSAAEATDRITLSHLEKRLPPYSGKDEFGKLVETLNRMISRIEEGVKQVQQFTQNAAHELRSPLTIQRGELEILYQREDLPEDVRSSLQKSLDRAIGMRKIVDNLMLLARSDTGRYPIQKKLFRLDEVMKEVVEDSQILAEHRPITVGLKHSERVEFFGDEQLIRHLLLNLSDNALKYTRNGTIEFGLRSVNNAVEISITDTGDGIPEEDLPRIFDRFYRVDKARTRNEGGSGLGLAICKWVANAHGGVITVESELGKGTVVRMSLPNSQRNSNPD